MGFKKTLLLPTQQETTTSQGLGNATPSGGWLNFHVSHASTRNNTSYIILGTRQNNQEIPLLRIHNGALQYNQAGTRSNQELATCC